MHVHYGFWLQAVFAVCLHQCHAHTCRDGERYSAWLPTRACTHHIKDVIKLVCASFPSFMGEESDHPLADELTLRSTKKEINHTVFCECCIHDCSLSDLMFFCRFVDRL
uniref:Uncharacterized protein LOC111105200 n=1 Tax=Crassostrea virginica TaxID=6565 RepID=A0A8B8AUT9_CRAVI|nr:uncharacterized protein LOC111105200 [Crassostrea virginica]